MLKKIKDSFIDLWNLDKILYGFSERLSSLEKEVSKLIIDTKNVERRLEKIESDVFQVSLLDNRMIAIESKLCISPEKQKEIPQKRIKKEKVK